MGYICIYIYRYLYIQDTLAILPHCLLDYQAYGYFRWDLGKIFHTKDCLEIELVSDCQNIRGTFKLSINSMSFIGDFEVEFSWLLPFPIRSVSHVKIMQLLYFKCYMRRWEENKMIWKYEVGKRRFLSGISQFDRIPNCNLRLGRMKHRCLNDDHPTYRELRLITLQFVGFIVYMIY